MWSNQACFRPLAPESRPRTSRMAQCQVCEFPGRTLSPWMAVKYSDLFFVTRGRGGDASWGCRTWTAPQSASYPIPLPLANPPAGPDAAKCRLHLLSMASDSAVTEPKCGGLRFVHARQARRRAGGPAPTRVLAPAVRFVGLFPGVGVRWGCSRPGVAQSCIFEFQPCQNGTSLHASDETREKPRDRGGHGPPPMRTAGWGDQSRLGKWEGRM